MAEGINMSWNSLQISDFRGISASTRNPDKNSAQAADNVDLRGPSGDLVTRKYYESIYSAPTHASLSSNTKLAAETIYVSDVGGGQEIIIAVTKGALSGTNLICIWATHQWNGSSWVANSNWHWLNECVKTTVTSRTSYAVVTGLTITDNQYDGWYVYNVTKAQYARVFISKAPNELHLTDSTGVWDASDALILMRNYIPYEYLTGNYNATTNDVTFHKVLDGLRIGFGGQPGRAALAVMYVNRTYNLTGFDFGDADYSNTTNLANFAATNRVICEVYNNRPTLAASISMLSSEVREEDQLPFGDYKVKMSSLLDGYNHFVDDNIYDFTSDGSHSICEFTPKIASYGPVSRVSAINIFMNKDDAGYNFVKTSDFQADKFKINTSGMIYPALVSETEQYPNVNAASWNESNTVGDWVADTGSLSVETSSPLSGSYSLKLTGSGTIQTHFFLNGIAYGQCQLKVTCKVKAPAGSPVTIAFSPGIPYAERPQVGTYLYTFTADGTTQDITHTFDIFYPIVYNVSFWSTVGSSESLFIDSLHIYMLAPFALRTPILPQALEDYIGYTPTNYYVLSWDHAVMSSGKTLMLNPYLDKRYPNKIFYSVIGAAFQYDVITAENYYDLENFDGNDLVGMAILNNYDIIAFKQNSVQYVNPDTGASRYIGFGNGCMNRRSITSIGDSVYWCGENGIFVTNGTQITDITTGSIKEAYKALGKTNIRSSYDELELSFVFTVTGLAEFVFTPKGWVTRDASVQSICFLRSKAGDLLRFSANGVHGPTSTYSSDSYTFIWKSAVLDAGLAGLPQNQKIKIRSYWIDYISTGSFTLTAKIYLDGSLFLTKTHSITSGERRASQRLPLVIETPALKNNACKRMYIELSGTNNAAQFNLKAVGLEWKQIAEGLNG
jgi:hypothetical protein